MRDYHHKPCSFYIIGENGEKLYGPGILPHDAQGLTAELEHENALLSADNYYLETQVTKVMEENTQLRKVIKMLVLDGLRAVRRADRMTEKRNTLLKLLQES